MRIFFGLNFCFMICVNKQGEGRANSEGIPVNLLLCDFNDEDCELIQDFTEALLAFESKSSPVESLTRQEYGDIQKAFHSNR